MKWIICNFEEFTNEQMKDIFLTASKGLDTRPLMNSKFNHCQMVEIALGLEDNLDVSEYNDPKYDWRSMHKIRKELEREKNNDYSKLPFSDYAKFPK